MDIASTVGPVIVLGVLVAFLWLLRLMPEYGRGGGDQPGVSVRTTQNLTLLAVTVLAGAATACCGSDWICGFGSAVCGACSAR